MKDFETLIVGGGPAGSSCAWELTRRGRPCAVLERQALPKTKLCAGWITPAVLRDLAFSPADYPHGLVTLRRMSVHLGLSSLRASFSTLQYSVRRREFDNWLLERCGAPVIRHAVRSIRWDGELYVVDEEFRGRYLVGAGGTTCPVRRAFFAPDRGRLILTQEVEYPGRSRTGECALFYPFAGFASYAWCVPKADAVNVGFGGVAERFHDGLKPLWARFARALVARGLLDAPPPRPSSHAYYVGDRRKEVRRGNAFIVGDAAGLATLDLGEGIGPAVRSGLAAAREIAGEGPYSPADVPERSMSGAAGRLLARFVCAS